MLFRKISLSKIVNFPKDRINIYKCRDFHAPVIYLGPRLGRVAEALAGPVGRDSVHHFGCSQGSRMHWGSLRRRSGLFREAAGQG